jgi:hypothetical protein
MGTTLPLARSAVRSEVTLSSDGEGVRCCQIPKGN